MSWDDENLLKGSAHVDHLKNKSGTPSNTQVKLLTL